MRIIDFHTHIYPNAIAKKAAESKMQWLVLWIIPVLNLFLHVMVWLQALGREVNMAVVMPLFMGVLFIILGNYLPKCRQSYTVGIKLPWTLHNEENWNKTHRFAGRLWLVCGLAIMLTAFIGGFWIFLPIVLIMVIAPLVYSYLLHRKGM